MDRVCVALMFAWALLGAAPAATAEASLPSGGVIEITVLFPAGSSADVTARLLADGMSRRLGRNVIAIAQVLVETPVVAVRADAKWQTLAALIAESKARPESITVGNSGVGSHTHITSVALFRAAGAHVVDVPFGAAEVITSLLGGQVDAVVQLPAALAEHVKSRQARLLAAMSASRDPAFPDVPTARELGWDVALEAWRGIAAPKGTPKNVIDAYEAAVKDTVGSPEFQEACLRLGARPAFLPADQFGALIAKQDAQLAQLMEVIGLTK